MKKIKRLIFIMFIFFIFIFRVNAVGLNFDVSSKNIILYNLNEDKVIYQKNPDDKVNIASLTKIMTLIVSIENINNYDEKILITNSMLNNLSYDLSKVGFKAGETVTYNDLLYGTLLKSGADATNILAISTTGSIENFVSLMNKKAEQLGMSNSHFSNTIGIEEGIHYSSARDIATLLKYSIKNEKFKEVFESRHYISTNQNHDMNGPLQMMKTKFDINLDYIKGAKTGYTSKAGLCLASIANYDRVDYLLVTIGADYENKIQHFEDNKKIYEYVFNNYGYKRVLSKGELIQNVKTIYGKEYTIISNEDINVYLNKKIKKSDLKYQYKGKTTLDKNVKKGDKIGTYYIKNNDEIIYTKSIISPTTVKFDLIFFVKNNIILIGLILIILILLISIFRIKRK